MKYLIPVLIAFFTISAEAVSLKYPHYDEIAKRLEPMFSNEHLDTVVVLEKRREGWFLASQVRTENNPFSRQLIWSSKTGEFFFDEVKADMRKRNQFSSLDVTEKFVFDACPYYGYVGFAKDVIDDYNEFDKYDDTVLYGVGLAYSNYSSNLLCNNQNFTDSAFTLRLKDGENCLNDADLQTYLKYQNTAISIFDKVAKIDPYFKTRVGSICLKRDHEYMARFMYLIQYVNADVAAKSLPGNLYSESILSFGNNLLESCPRDAVLFAQGDTDTFTMWYLQYAKGIRKDVTVVNTSLFSTPRYISYLSRLPDPVNMGLNLDVLNKFSANYRYVLCGNLGSVDDKALCDSITNSVEEHKSFSLPGKSIDVKLCGKEIKLHVNRKYFLTEELFMILLIARQYESRPVCFGTHMRDVYESLGLGKLMQTNGLISVIKKYAGEVDFDFSANASLFRKLQYPTNFSDPDIDKYFEYHTGLIESFAYTKAEDRTDIDIYKIAEKYTRAFPPMRSGSYYRPPYFIEIFGVYFDEKQIQAYVQESIRYCNLKLSDPDITSEGVRDLHTIINHLKNIIYESPTQDNK